ncbi:retinaldehyde-binding protein 1-like [Anopheles darlingi]|uniref:retinaldehyde-binding protein 1-like n=1 Tax=Anopheles darlingi TaxID=43151 RepID=UPI0021005420|nr:retinaldehyde-binding protein 1-like [Anopheles darlingi]
MEDKYTFTLPELYREIAKEELRETDQVREVAITQMREWIVRNKHIHKCRTDASFLLRFLRANKFSVPMACEGLERYLAVREMYPGWFKHLDIMEPATQILLKDGPASVLGQDSVGRTVVLFQLKLFNADQVTPVQISRYASQILETMLESEEVQIGGIMILLDYTAVSMKVFQAWGATEMKIAMEGFTHCYPVTYREIHAAKLPKIAIPIMEQMLSFASPKLREIIHCYATVAEIQKYMEPSITPKQYGGNMEHDLSVVNKRFWDRMVELQDVVTGLDKMEIDMDYYTEVWDKLNPDLMEARSFKNLTFD